MNILIERYASELIDFQNFLKIVFLHLGRSSS